jgi:hypothetical protein
MTRGFGGGSGANFGTQLKRVLGARRGSCGENCDPNFGRGFAFDAKLAEFELTLPDPMDEFNAGDRRCGSTEMFEAEHRTQPKLDRSVILLDQIVQIFRGSDLALISLGMFAESLFCRPMRSLITVERDLARKSSLMPECSSEKCLGGRDIPLGAEQEIDSLSLFVDRTVKVGSAAFDLDVSFVDTPGTPSLARITIPAFLELRDVALDPTHDCRVRKGEPAFGHHFDEVSKAELVAQIPAHAEDNDLPVEMAAFEKIIHAQRARQLCRSASLCSARAVCTRATSMALNSCTYQ